MAPIKLRTNTMTSSCWRPPGPRTHTACDLLSSPRPSQMASQGSHHRPAAARAHPRHSFMPVIVARRPGHHHHAGAPPARALANSRCDSGSEKMDCRACTALGFHVA
ncbi:hypothetical protein ACCO45_013294 [Purpureocillium lilacinum]|uniref:Uncharacterized protein n=1 Tax=Purpureocillium lilacinum TaxID=33203 RepID=A0ACC4DD12_PURLI